MVEDNSNKEMNEDEELDFFADVNLNDYNAKELDSLLNAKLDDVEQTKRDESETESESSDEDNDDIFNLDLAFGSDDGDESAEDDSDFDLSSLFDEELDSEESEGGEEKESSGGSGRTLKEILEAAGFNTDEDDEIVDNDNSDFSDFNNDDGYSDEFLDKETEYFKKTLEVTIRCRENPAQDANNFKVKTTRSYGSKSAKYKKHQKTIESVLNSIREYNENGHNKNYLSEELARRVTTSEYNHRELPYNDKGRLVWTYCVDVMEGTLKDSELNEFASQLTPIYDMFQKMCESYRILDSEEKINSINRDKRRKMNLKEYAFLYEVQRRLNEDGERVAVCNSLTFDANNVTKYKFHCGNCHELVSGATELTGPNGEKIPDCDSHNFYQLLTKNTISLHYPMVCEKCGAINCLSHSSREMMSKGIKSEPTADSLDDRDYLNESRSARGKVVIGNRVYLPYNKWKDLLRFKIDNGLAEDSDNNNLYDVSMDALMDSEFFIDVEESAVNDDLIVEVSNDAYKEAIKEYRRRNTIFNKRNELDKFGGNGMEIALALLASRNQSTLLNNSFDLLASYIIGTKTFNNFERLCKEKNLAYSKMASLRSACYYLSNGLQYASHSIESMCKRYNIENDYDVIKESYDVALKEYEDSVKRYEDYKNLMMANPLIFAYFRKDRISGALERVAIAFECDYESFSQFMNDTLKSALTLKCVTDVKSTMGLTGKKGKITQYKVSGLSTVDTYERNKSNKRQTILTYAKAVEDTYPALGKEFSERYGDTLPDVIKELDVNYGMYVRYGEWKRAYGINDNTLVDDVLKDKSMVSDYETYLMIYHGLLDEYKGQTISVFNPNFSKCSFFNILFGEYVAKDKCVLADANRIVNSLIELKDYKLYDSVFSLMVIKASGLQAYTGMSNLTIAEKLNLAEGRVVRLYDSNVAKLAESLESQEVFDSGLEKITNHSFVDVRNDEACIGDFIRLLTTKDRVDGEDAGDAVQFQIGTIESELLCAESKDTANEEYVNQLKREMGLVLSTRW